MRRYQSILAIAVSAGLLASGALAQSPGGAPPTGMPMPGGMPQGMPQGMPGSSPGGMPMAMEQMAGMMGGHIEGRIAFLKTELKITEAQQKLFDAVAEAMRANAKGMAGGMTDMMAMMGGSAKLPGKLAAQEKMMTAHLEQLKRLKAAVDPLYAALNDAQKKTADEIMLGPMGTGMM